MSFSVSSRVWYHKWGGTVSNHRKFQQFDNKKGGSGEKEEEEEQGEWLLSAIIHTETRVAEYLANYNFIMDHNGRKNSLRTKTLLAPNFRDQID
jgi:hypothetical protein